MSRNNYSTQKLSSLASLRNNDNASPSYGNKNETSNLRSISDHFKLESG